MKNKGKERPAQFALPQTPPPLFDKTDQKKLPVYSPAGQTLTKMQGLAAG